MPVHRVPRADIEDAYKRISRSGEEVQHIIVDGDEFVFFTFLDVIDITTAADNAPRYVTRDGLTVETRA